MRILPILLVLLAGTFVSAQQPSEPLYDPDANALEQIHRAVQTASLENKHVLVQIGGNWCPWCIKLHNFIEANPSLDSLIKADYILVHINYSKENKNPGVMTMLEYPQRFGFPVLVILDGNGKRLNTQNTAYLEDGDSYNKEKLKEFLLNWSPAAVNPKTYENQ